MRDSFAAEESHRPSTKEEKSASASGEEEAEEEIPGEKMRRELVKRKDKIQASPEGDQSDDSWGKNTTPHESIQEKTTFSRNKWEAPGC